MAAIRKVIIENFRGFEAFEVVLRDHAVVVGEPGSGKSDLVEALIRVLDAESLRGRRASDLDVLNLDLSRSARIELTIGDLSAATLSALFDKVEFWDLEDELLIRSLPAGTAPDPARHEQVIRIGYRLAFDGDEPLETVYYPKFADHAAGLFPRAPQAERQLIPFYWQRGVATKPLDLAGRGQLRDLIDRQTGEDFSDAVDRLMDAVQVAAESFSSQDRVSAALTAVLAPLRQVRRFHPTASAGDLIRFLPDGGAPSGLLRSLAAAITLTDSPDHFPALRHGTSLLAALRGGALIAAAASGDRPIIVIDDLGGEYDPFLARHLGSELRRNSGQLVAATHAPDVVRAFSPEEVVRLYSRQAARMVARGVKPTNRAERLSARYLSSSLIDALTATSVIVVEGHHDRLGYAAVIERAVESGALPSFDAAGITILEAGGDGDVAKIAAAAKALGLFTVAVLDNDRGDAAATAPAVQSALAVADAVIRLPPRMELEHALTEGVPDPDLSRAINDLQAAFGDLALPVGWNALTGQDMRRAVRTILHNRPGSLHRAFIDALPRGFVPPEALRVASEAHRVATTSTTGLFEL